jgi:hypothetical protein
MPFDSWSLPIRSAADFWKEAGHMVFRKASAALAAASLAVSSVAVQAAPAARESAPVVEANELSGIDYFFVALAAAVLIWAIIEETNGPDSP